MEQSAGKVFPRYEDFTEDGRPLVSALPATLGAVWRSILAGHPDGPKMRDEGIVPILTRIEIETSEDSFSAVSPMEVFGSGDILVGQNTEEDHARVLLDVRARVVAKTGHAMLPFAAVRKEKQVGTILGEHALTRLFAEKDQRRVGPEDLKKIGIALGSSRPWSPPRALLVASEGERAIDRDFVRDDTPIVFGLMHTDANQHVNSMVYPRVFEESIVRRLAKLGRSTRVLSRKLQIGYRKPSFCGETLFVESRIAEVGDRLVAVGAFVEPNEKNRDRARAFVRLELTA